MNKKYKKDNAPAIEKYESVVKTLTELYPDKKLPNLENLERERTALIKKRKNLNDDYKNIVAELKEIEYAQTSIRAYIKNLEQSAVKKNENLE